MSTCRRRGRQSTTVSTRATGSAGVLRNSDSESRRVDTSKPDSSFDTVISLVRAVLLHEVLLPKVSVCVWRDNDRYQCSRKIVVLSLLYKDNSFAGADFSAIPVRTVHSHLGIDVLVFSRDMKVDNVTPQSFFPYSQLAVGCICRLQADKKNVYFSPKQLDEWRVCIIQLTG